MTPARSLRARLAAGETLRGAFLGLGSAAAAEALGLAGLDWLLVDLEHAAPGEATLLPQLLGARAAGTPCLVRVESDAPARAARALDAGADGVMCPRVDSAAAAAAWVRALRHPPAGTRGVAGATRAAGYGTGRPVAGEHPLAVVQIESPAAVAAAVAIAAVDGVDALFVGPTDLAHALGCPRDVAQPRLLDAIGQVAGAAARAGKAAGIFAAGPGELAAARAAGLRLIAAGSDVAFLLAGARAALAA